MHVSEHISPLINCDLCGSPVEHMAYVVARGEQRLLDISLPLTIMVCRHCRFIFQGQSYSDKLLAALYAHDGSFAFGENDNNRPLVHKHLAERQQVISNAMAIHGLLHGANVLDVGGGIGECCVHLIDKHEVVVADASNSIPANPRISKVDGLFSGQLALESFDVVVLNHVLEHVFSPTALLESTHQVLRAGGIAVIEVPFELFTPLLARHLGDWRHVVYYSRSTLSQFLQKTGFEVERIELVEGCYGVRRLPVIRALARKNNKREYTHLVQRQSSVALFRDMLTPVALHSLANRAIRRSS